ncbi:MAG: 23S rRNA (uridine(2552)-2'-O)-methyltransferase RlmE [Cellvibrionales bacterium]|jgi:23S rRNA (uridine2552-2'-O)-methyltransferase|nr:23S rRNA (uridine(2552)-2'-O)-methyltransferase RlmE [Cellvibrionales bacterium]MDA7737032.1 23S rRNA (uridine(2552)-2'-O)-methyltransferase RlmE [Porticoccus sp.]MDC0412302.1 23S rRNA (uridine(2552)-2'-O)-methyltransferase RlmE [Porticoccus sp.]MDC0888014.1 23S rRNA (uridine(2552)-2'-O)-methyltransferase RlmE [Porticoccus sp.]MDC1270888.1 23S rRNA (uridine(2552)-2'-O)-methyltransferase RlmE [Porticoccus sp.]
MAVHSKSSQKWLQEHHRDQYVKRAQTDGYRSRASYKLIEINQKDKIFKPGLIVVDLGAAPGGWSQVAAKLVGPEGKIVASDILKMDPIDKVDFVLGDFTNSDVLQNILNLLDNNLVDLVISDMAPNMSGIRGVDQTKAMYLIELALDMACKVLKPGGNFVVKVFHGEGFDQYMLELKKRFKRVMSRKPDASRSRSREVYFVAKNFKR